MRASKDATKPLLTRSVSSVPVGQPIRIAGCDSADSIDAGLDDAGDSSPLRWMYAYTAPPPRAAPPAAPMRNGRMLPPPRYP